MSILQILLLFYPVLTCPPPACMGSDSPQTIHCFFYPNDGEVSQYAKIKPLI